MRKLFPILTTVILIFSLMFPPMLTANSCTTGGQGATDCEIQGSVGVALGGLFKGIEVQFEVSHAVSCGDGYYACCNFSGATCIENE